MAEVTPRRVMFEDLRRFAGLDYHDACCLLLSTRPVAGGLSPRDSLEVMHRSSIMRNYVDVTPEKTNSAHFGELSNASLNVIARLVARQGAGAATRAMIAEHYRGPAAGAMAAALDAWGLSGQAYLNAVECVDMAVLPASKDRVSLYVMLFVATGCLQDPARAVQTVEDFLERRMGGHFSSTKLRLDGGGGERSSAPAAEVVETTLGLILREGNIVRLPAHELSRDPEGTVIGYLPAGTNVIGAPDGSVSARHLRIWREGGRWYAQGLGSTAGTTLRRGLDGQEVVVEPPRAEAEPGREYPPVEIHVGDELCLGGKVTYIVAQGRIG